MGFELKNHYGPTETTVVATSGVVRGGGGGATWDRSADSERGGIRTGRGTESCAGGSIRGAVRRRGGIGARVLGTSGADGGEVRAGPVWRRGGQTSVPDGGSVPVGSGWRVGVFGTPGPPGEGSW